MIQVVFRQARLARTGPEWAVLGRWVCVGAYAVFAGMTWFFYRRRRVEVQRVPSLAYAAI